MRSVPTWQIGLQIAASLIGLVALFIGYYWVHKPLNPALIQSLGGAVLDALTVTLIGAVAGGLGRRVLARVNLSPISRAERVALEGALGLGLMSLGALVLGLVKLYSGGVFWLALAIVAVISARSVVGWLTDMWRLVMHAARPTTTWAGFLTIILGLLLLTALLNTFVPPYAWDSLVYHLVGPQRYLAAGRIAAQPDNHFMGFPQGAEVLFGVAMALFGRDTAAAPLHFLFGLLALLAIAGLTYRYVHVNAALLAGVLLLSAYSLWALFGEPYVDLAVIAYCAAALVAAISWRETQRSGWLALMGLYAGLALGVKYTAVGLLLALIVYVAWNTPRSMIRNGILVVGVAGLVFIPWLVKGVLLYGNPVYPYFFGGVNWDAQRAVTFNGTSGGLLFSSDAWQLIVLPLAATVFGVEKGAGFSFAAGPWLLTAWLLLIPGWRWLDDRMRQLARDCLTLGVPLLGFWIVIAAFTGLGLQPRLIAVALPVAAIAGSLGFSGLARLPRKPLDLHFMFRGALVITLFLVCLEVLTSTVQTGVVPYLLALRSRDDFLTDNIGTYINAMRRLRDLPTGATVRLMWEPRSYYCPATVRCIPDILTDHWFNPVKHGSTPDEIFENWQREHDDYLLLFQTGYDFYTADSYFAVENALFPEALDHWMTPVWSDVGYTLYTWKTRK